MPGLVPVIWAGRLERQHEKLKEITGKMGVTKAWRRVAGLGKLAWRKTKEQDGAFDRTPELRDAEVRVLEPCLGSFRKSDFQALR